MTATLSSKGQIVLNASIRRSMHLVPGTVFKVKKENHTIVLEPLLSGRPAGKISKNSRTGFSVLDAGETGVLLSSDRVRDMLAEFP
jgi:AbrB family looped-hinge helix DNA binding protein